MQNTKKQNTKIQNTKYKIQRLRSEWKYCGCSDDQRRSGSFSGTVAHSPMLSSCSDCLSMISMVMLMMSKYMPITHSEMLSSCLSIISQVFQPTCTCALARRVDQIRWGTRAGHAETGSPSDFEQQVGWGTRADHDRKVLWIKGLG